MLRSMLRIVDIGGRFIIGFSESYKDKYCAINRIKGLGFKISGVLKNRYNKNNPEVVVWLDIEHNKF